MREVERLAGILMREKFYGYNDIWYGVACKRIH